MSNIMLPSTFTLDAMVRILILVCSCYCCLLTSFFVLENKKLSVSESCDIFMVRNITMERLKTHRRRRMEHWKTKNMAKMRGTDIEKKGEKKEIPRKYWAVGSHLSAVGFGIQHTWDSSHSMARFFHVIVLHLELYSRVSILFEFIHSHISNGATSFISLPLIHLLSTQLILSSVISGWKKCDLSFTKFSLRNANWIPK